MIESVTPIGKIWRDEDCHTVITFAMIIIMERTYNGQKIASTFDVSTVLYIALIQTHIYEGDFTA